MRTLENGAITPNRNLFLENPKELKLPTISKVSKL
jgi:hypothetical protein